jgi:hypothetical protein
MPGVSAALMPIAKAPETNLSTNSGIDRFETRLPVVYRVRERRAGLGDQVTLIIWRLHDWVANRKADAEGLPGAARPEGSRSESQLILFLDNQPIKGCYSGTITEQAVEGSRYTYSHVTFPLTRTETNKDVWAQWLLKPKVERDVALSVGFEDAKASMSSLIKAENGPASVPDHDESGFTRFSFVVISQTWLWVALVLVGTLLFALFYFAAKSDILRDPFSSSRPDGKRPFSLARMQMAFWFFLVLSSYLLIWIITGAQYSITGSVLALIGISAGAALGSAIIDSGKNVTAPSASALQIAKTPDVSNERLREILSELRAQLVSKLTLIEGQLGRTPSPPESEQKDLREALANTFRQVKEIDSQIDYLKLPRWRRLMTDLLADGGSISFHRFQIFAWTIVLGIIFCAEVFDRLAMPLFDNTMLALMGISAGTFLGFKLPDQGKN